MVPSKDALDAADALRQGVEAELRIFSRLAGMAPLFETTLGALDTEGKCFFRLWRAEMMLGALRNRVGNTALPSGDAPASAINREKRHKGGFPGFDLQSEKSRHHELVAFLASGLAELRRLFGERPPLEDRWVKLIQALQVMAILGWGDDNLWKLRVVSSFDWVRLEYFDIDRPRSILSRLLEVAGVGSAQRERMLLGQRVYDVAGWNTEQTDTFLRSVFSPRDSVISGVLSRYEARPFADFVHALSGDEDLIEGAFGLHRVTEGNLIDVAIGWLELRNGLSPLMKSVFLRLFYRRFFSFRKSESLGSIAESMENLVQGFVKSSPRAFLVVPVPGTGDWEIGEAVALEFVARFICAFPQLKELSDVNARAHLAMAHQLVRLLWIEGFSRGELTPLSVESEVYLSRSLEEGHQEFVTHSLMEKVGYQTERLTTLRARIQKRKEKRRTAGQGKNP